MSETSQEEKRFNLDPDPRILPMLGEINLNQWRCLAELIDNSVDGFLSAKRSDNAISAPEVVIALPTRDREDSRVSVKDNGPGMSAEQLERAVRAGWSGNSPIDSLGMFGMGFNIATARLGKVTTVWTTRADDLEWHGVRIDFEELSQQGDFETDHLTKPKLIPSEHGTEIVIESLKPNQRQWLSKTANRSRVNRELSRTYAAMLRSNGVPISFDLKLNGNLITERNHCVWGESRFVETSRHGRVAAFQVINQRLADRPFCLRCWQWLPSTATACAYCKDQGNVVIRERHVKGWIGIQRYLHATEFGIDFIRNGRKIELASKDMFIWNDGESEKPEYPIDDPRGRGRIVGEIHLDHCRVTYTKDRFDRNDPAWEEMTSIIRGPGPLQPKKAAELGIGENSSPLFRLYQAFRRSSPKPRNRGCWSRLLVVQDNDLAADMAKRFHAKEAAFVEDVKWWELVEEQDAQLLGNDDGEGNSSSDSLPGFGDNDNTESEEDNQNENGDGNEPAPPPVRNPYFQLSQDFLHESTGQTWAVEAFRVSADDPELHDHNRPWKLTRNNNGVYSFFVNTNHEIFQSATMTVLDGILSELAWSASDFLRGQNIEEPFSKILADLRHRYAKVSTLDPVVLESDARQTISSIIRAFSSRLEPETGQSLFEELSPSDKEQTLTRMSRNPGQIEGLINSGGFFIHAPPSALLACFSRHAELFFDGRCWPDQFSDLTLLHEHLTEVAKLSTIKYYEGLLNDTIWLAETDLMGLNPEDRPRILRASLALELLTPCAPTVESADG